MLGAIIGDIIGSRWEFNPTNDYNFPLFSDKNGFTDDTICTIAVADALLHDSDDYGKFIHEWCRKYPHPKGGYGGRFAKWVASNHPQPYHSYGNGSAMRVSPIGWMFNTPQDLFTEAEKSAACTHNHEEGILGAQAVAYAIRDCNELRKEHKGKKITKEDILYGGINHAVILYYEWPSNFHLDIKQYINKFDETCRGTVPVALWIVLHSKNFEDAIRQAVALGGDADTLAAITGSIAEALWGIPQWMKEKALSYLPYEMKKVVTTFHKRLNRLRKLTKDCKYYKIESFFFVEDYQKEAYEVEKQWAHDLAKSYHYADKAKEALIERNAIVDWRGDYADVYGLPLSLIGYIVDHVAPNTFFTAECKKSLETFLNKYYEVKHPKVQVEEASDKEKKEHLKTMMLWKLGLGHMGKMFNGEDPMPKKSAPPTEKMIKQGLPMSYNNEVSDYKMSLNLTKKELNILRMGHIPEAQEDHWFMYTDDEYIRYYRSWTGICAFEAHYKKDGKNYCVDHLRINQALCEFGVNGDEAGVWLFRYLLTAEVGGDAHAAWQNYLDVWEHLENKYSKK